VLSVILPSLALIDKFSPRGGLAKSKTQDFKAVVASDVGTRESFAVESLSSSRKRVAVERLTRTMLEKSRILRGPGPCRGVHCHDLDMFGRREFFNFCNWIFRRAPRGTRDSAALARRLGSTQSSRCQCPRDPGTAPCGQYFNAWSSRGDASDSQVEQTSVEAEGPERREEARVVSGVPRRNGHRETSGKFLAKVVWAACSLSFRQPRLSNSRRATERLFRGEVNARC